MAAVDVATNAAGSGAVTGNGNVDPLAPKKGAKADPNGYRVLARWKKASDELVKQRRDYWQNVSMFYGDQWIYWDPRRNMLQSLPQAWSPLGRGRARTVTNLLRSSLLSLLGRMLRNDLEFDVPPTDSADDVVSAAMLAEDVLTAAHHDQDWRGVRYRENFAKFMGGTSAVCVEWDGSAGTTLSVDPRTHAVTGTGETSLTSMSVNEFAIQPGIRDARQAIWWIQALCFAPDVVKARFNLDWTPQADASTLMSPLQQRLLEHMGQARGANQLTMVLTEYERPNPACPAGRYTVIVNGMTVHESPKWPFPDKTRLNLFVFHQQQVDDTWVGTTLMNDAVPIQVSYNFMRSIIAEHAKKVGNARLMAPTGSFEEEDLTDDPGSILFFSPDLGGALPQYLRPPDLPRWLANEAAALRAELDDVMFVHDVSRGQAGFDRASGQALALLAEKDDSPLGLMAFEESQRWSEIGTYVLSLYEAKVTETRKIQVRPRAGQPGIVRPAKWSGKRLKGQTRCEVPLETTLPVSQAAEQAFARDLWDRGLIKDPMQFARLLRIPQRELLDVIDADVAKAQRENVLIALGEAPMVEQFDDHAKHIAEHNRWRKSDSYTYADPDVRKVGDDHITWHQQVAAEQLGKQTQLASQNPALAASPQADEPVGSMVPPDFAEQQAGNAMVGASVQAQQGAPPGTPQPGAPEGGPPGAPPPPPGPGVAMAGGMGAPAAGG